MSLSEHSPISYEHKYKMHVYPVYPVTGPIASNINFFYTIFRFPFAPLQVHATLLLRLRVGLQSDRKYARLLLHRIFCNYVYAKRSAFRIRKRTQSI